MAHMDIFLPELTLREDFYTLGEIPIVQCPFPYSSVTLYASVLQYRCGMVYTLSPGLIVAPSPADRLTERPHH